LSRLLARRGGVFLQGGAGSDHFGRNQIPGAAKMLERALGLSAPQLVRRHVNYAKAVDLSTVSEHVVRIPT
jgi:hypothetical protein